MGAEPRDRVPAQHQPGSGDAAAGELFSVAHVTPEELQRMREQVIEVMAPYVRMEPDSRPAGARCVLVAALAVLAAGTYPRIDGSFRGERCLVRYIGFDFALDPGQARRSE